MSASTVMCAAGKNPRTTFRSGRISTSRRHDQHRWAAVAEALVLAALNPVLEHLQRHRAVVIGSLGDGLVVAFLDPALVGRGAVARQRQPHQAASSLTRQLVASEQHLPEQRLRLVLALLRGKAEPTRGISEIIA